MSGWTQKELAELNSQLSPEGRKRWKEAGVELPASSGTKAKKHSGPRRKYNWKVIVLGALGFLFQGLGWLLYKMGLGFQYIGDRLHEWKWKHAS